MPLFATPIYAALLAALYILLSLQVIRQRQRDGRAWGEGGEGRLRNLVRAHGNFAEYAPMGIVLLLLAEAQGAPGWAVHLTGASLLAGRVVHAFALSERPAALQWRVAGMVLTFTALGTGALAALFASLAA
jgi:uncharacterized membrane protein YecN with MAPEG domain